MYPDTSSTRILINRGPCRVDGNDVSIIWVGSTMWITTAGRPLGTDQARMQSRTIRPRRTRPVKLAQDTISGPWRTTCWMLVGLVQSRLPVVLAREASQELGIAPRQPDQDLCLPVGSRDLRQKAARISLTTTLARRLGSILAASSSSESSRLVRTACPSSRKPSHNLALCPVDGRCVLRPLLECTLSTTTPRRQPGMTRVYHHRSIRTCRSTSETSDESSFTSDRNLLSARTLVNVTSRCLVTTFSRVVTLKS